MTFDGMKQAVKSAANLSSAEADTRVGESLNQHYRRVTAAVGMDPTRPVTRTETTTNGVQTVTFEEIEKIDRILDTTTGVRRVDEVSKHKQRSLVPGPDAPCTWALQSSTASTVTILLDCLPQSTYTLQADGLASLADLTSDDEPAFPESFHNILVWFTLEEELLRKEKVQLAAVYHQKAEKLLSDLQFHFADSPTMDLRQAGSSLTSLSGGGSAGGSSSLGGTAYTQTALVTYDLGAGIAPFAIAQSNAPTVANLDADELDGEDGSYYLDRANHTGSLGYPSWIDVTFSAGDFTGSSSMTWTVGASDQTTFKYVKFGTTMTVAFVLNTTSVGGTPSTALQIAIPGGFTAVGSIFNSVFLIDNSARTTGYAAVVGPTIFLSRTDGAAFTASTDATSVFGQITFETTA